MSETDSRSGARGRRRAARAAGAAGALLLLLTSCTWLPAEFNLSPLYRQRLDENGDLLELDVLWPIVHYERTPEGGDDFRIRPLYRRVTEPDNPVVVGRSAVEHQYLWPLGKIRSDGEQTLNRLFPLWSHTARPNVDGQRETDWYVLFPFFWGGSREDGEENYFGFFPFYADLPEFLIYDRLLFILWPIYTRTEQSGRRGNVVLWPLAGWGYGPNEYKWHRFLPFWSYSAYRDYRRTSVLWPFVHWGTEHAGSDDPVTRWHVWPFFGRQWSESGRFWGWTTLWPLFQYTAIVGRYEKLILLWPFFRIEEDVSEFRPLWRLWIFPFVARTMTHDQFSWVFLWPFIWLREYQDPQGVHFQRWFIPLYWWDLRQRRDGSEEELVKLWPLWHRSEARSPEGPVREHWSFLSLWPWHGGFGEGIREIYGFLWTIAQGRRRAIDDKSVEFVANIFTTRQRGERRQTSVPFLFSYDGDADSGTLRLFQLLPIPWWGTGTGEEKTDG